MMRFIELAYGSDIMLLSLWVESGGFVKDFSERSCRVPKKQLLNVIDEIKRAFQ